MSDIHSGGVHRNPDSPAPWERQVVITDLHGNLIRRWERAVIDNVRQDGDTFTFTIREVGCG